MFLENACQNANKHVQLRIDCLTVVQLQFHAVKCHTYRQISFHTCSEMSPLQQGKDQIDQFKRLFNDYLQKVQYHVSCPPCHLLTLSLTYHLTYIPSHLFAMSLAHYVTCSPCRLLTMSLANHVTYSPCQLLTMSLAHHVMLMLIVIFFL